MMTRHPGRTLTLATLAAALFAQTANSETLPSLYDWRFKPPVKTIDIRNAKDLSGLFGEKNYTLPKAGATPRAPRLYLSRLVPDMANVQPPSAHQSLFIRTVAPLVLRANEKIVAQRKTLESILAIQAKGQTLSADKENWLEVLAELYTGKKNDFNSLPERVDTIPASLAISQAIVESGWGTARLALKSNGMFGQHESHWLRSGSVRAASGNVSVAAFPSLLDGVSAYMTNLNRHAAYAKLRAIRTERRRKGEPPDGHALAAGLVSYSARGEDYVKTLRRLISRHGLSIYDTATLTADGDTVLIREKR